MLTRRQWLMSAIAAVAGGGAMLKPSKADAQHEHEKKPEMVRGRRTHTTSVDSQRKHAAL